jgi:hypothetical protein
MKNQATRLVGAGENDVLLFLHTARPPSPKEWDDSMATMKRYAITNDFRRLRVLVVSDGGGPDSTMRGQLQELFKSREHSPATSVITTSVIGRGIVAAVSWFQPQIKAFSPRGFAEALAHLGLSRATAPRLLREFSEMERELSPSSCLTLIAGALTSATL